MNKKQAVFIICVSVILTLLVNIFFGRYIMAKVSTWPVLNRLRLLSPEAPIVITNNQTVRMKLADYDVDAISALDRSVRVRECHPIGSAGLGGIALAQLPNLLQRRDDQLDMSSRGV